MPKIEQFKGIENYTTAGKLVTRISPEGNLFRAINFVVETEDGASYLKLENGRMQIKADVTFSSSSPALEQTRSIAQSLTDNLEIGGRNMCRNSEIVKLGAYGGASVTYQENYNMPDWGTNKAVRHTVTGGTSVVSCLFNLGVPAQGQTISVSFYAKNLSTTSKIKFHSNLGRKFHILNSGQSARIKFEGIVGSGGGAQLHIQARTIDNKNLDFVIAKCMYEKGHKATDWKPAYEDIQQQIEIAKAEANNAVNTANRLSQKTDFLSDTKINGNTIATGTLQVGNSQGANAGITGVGGSNAVRFYAGTHFNGRNIAPYRVTNDGKIFAQIGYIGAFEIVGGKLTSANTVSTGGSYYNPNTGQIEYWNNMSSCFVVISANQISTHENSLTEWKSVTIEKAELCVKRETVSSEKSVKITPDSIFVDDTAGWSGYHNGFIVKKGIIIGTY